MEHEDVFEYFAAQAIITEPRAIVKSGKEAVVYRCDAHPAAGVEAVAIKIYKDIETRSFKNMKGYLDGRIGRTLRKRRDILHLYSTPSSMQAFWVDAENSALEALYAAGLSVPKPLCASQGALAMEFIAEAGTAREPRGAPRLRDAELSRGAAERVMGELVSAVGAMLSLDIVHGDLSAYNVLMRGEKPVIIDFPQAADARYSSQARFMLERDLENAIGFFRRWELPLSLEAPRLAAELWARYQSGELYQERRAAELALEWGLADFA